MPPKKTSATVTDQTRKGDLSSARFVPVDGAQTPEPTASEAPAADESTVETLPQDLASDKKDGVKKEEKDAVTIEDLTLPKSIVTRLAKGVLPPNTQIQANAILAMSKSATVFINYLASHANEHTFNANKKTISPADVFKALDDIEFGFLKEPLEAEFAKFTAMQTEKRNTNRKKSTGGKPEDTDMADASTASAGPAAAATTTTTPDTGLDHKDRDEDGKARAAKKQRVGEAAGAATAATAAGSAATALGGSETEEDIDATVDEERDEDEDDDDEVEEEEEEEEAEDSGDETQDAMEDRLDREDRDEALDGDDSD